MNGKFECIVTGIVLVDPIQERWIRGDLHHWGDILVVNATGCDWVVDKTPIPADAKAVLCATFYEKNNQIVLPLALCQFNTEANAYINETLKDAPRIIIPGDTH
jgi:hypothetical protein